ncbi:acyl-CoA N-acyltransferase [Xylariales sp. PMI_506]|nr:acyl-CoA N-acyltransferase [Xylariales sp. PMI_506]
MAIQLRQATDGDIPAIAEVGAAAFDVAADAIVRNILPPHLQPEGTSERDTQIGWLTRRVTRSLGDPNAVLLVAQDETAKIVGCALWIAPHVEEIDKSRPPPAFPPNMNKEAMKELKTVLTSKAEAVFGEVGSSVAWELDFLAVHPDYQRRGIGMALLRWGSERAKKESKDCYIVAAAAGRPLYLAGGFEEIGQLDLFAVPHTQMLIKNNSTPQ